MDPHRLRYHYSRTELALFGLVWLVFFGTVGTLAWSRNVSPGIVTSIWSAAIIVPVVGWIAPGFMRIVAVGTMLVAWPIRYVLSYVILAVVWYLVITPIGLLTRLVGYDPLQRRFDSRVESYWVPRERNDDFRGYFRQY